MVSRSFVIFFSEKLTFRFINLEWVKSSTFNFNDQNKYSKFDVKPCERNQLLPVDEVSDVQPVLRAKMVVVSDKETMYFVVI